MHRKTLLIFFLIFSLLVPGAFAAGPSQNRSMVLESQVKQHTNATLSYYKLQGTKNFYMGALPIKKLHYNITLVSGTIVSDGKYYTIIDLPINGTVWGFPKSKNVNNHLYTFAELTVEVTLEGPKTNSLNAADCDPVDGGGGPAWESDGGHVAFSDPDGLSFDTKTYPQGVYWLSVTISLKYEINNKYGDWEKYSFTTFSAFNDIMLVKYTDSSDALKVTSNAFSSVFGLVGSLWGTAESQIGALDWGTLLKLDVLGFLGEIVNMLSILGYALFETFVMPPTAISLIMSMQTSAMVLSLFVLAYVALLVAIVGGMIVLYKVILLLKP